MAVKRVIMNFKIVLEGKVIRVYTDNQNVAHILKIGSRKRLLQDNVMCIHTFCSEHSINLSSVWIPREENEYADILSIGNQIVMIGR